MTHRQCGPGMPKAIAPPPLIDNAPEPLWWIDEEVAELVRSADGKRWDTWDVPELQRSSKAMDAADVTKIDDWVRSQPRE